LADPLLLRGGRVVTDGAAAPRLIDLAIGADGRITRLGVALPAAGARVIDLAGRLVVPGLVDMHQHLDKSRIVRDVPNPSGTLDSALDAFRRYAAGLTVDAMVRSARRTLEACLARGTVAIRSHANVDRELGGRAVEALVRLREESRDRVRLQVVAFLTSSGARSDTGTARAMLEAALDAGAEVVGGVPALAPDPPDFLDMLFDVATRRGCRLDLHVDETLEPRPRYLDGVIERTRALGLGGRVVASHCSLLSALDREEARPLLEGLAAAGIGVVTLPAANLFLQGREAVRLAPRGLTRVADLLAAGVRVACGSDNVQDPFVPVGSGDMLEIARWTILAAHLLADAPATAFRMATATPARLMGLGDEYGIHEGAWADLLVTDAEDVDDLVRSGPLERAVLYRGRLVAGRLDST
jgi:cytosine deaminase